MVRKLTLEQVRNYISESGDLLLSDSYCNNKTLLTINCSKCHEDYLQTFDRYKRGHRHKICPNTKRKRKPSSIVKISTVKMPKKCKQCGITFMKKRREQFLCSRTCAKKSMLIVKNRPEQISACRRGGKLSAANQTLRSRNEIYFAELCEKQFKDVLTNKQMFDGWDADVIIPSLKMAVHWNGIWHYKQIKTNHNLENTQHRDRIKLKVIKKHGYQSYIIKDMGKADKKFVEQEFEKFMDYIYFI